MKDELHLEIKHLGNASSDIRKEVTNIFVEAYYSSLRSISKDFAQLNRLFYEAFLLDHFYGAFIGNELVGFFALTDSKERSFRFNKRTFIGEFGYLKGTILYNILKKELEHEIELQETGYNIESVATKKEFQGKGIGKKMMEYAIENNNYLELDVVDTNVNAFKLYKKLGFTIFKEKPVKGFKTLVEYNKKIFMKYKKYK